jgi:HK97 family phage major capsid protein
VYGATAESQQKPAGIVAYAKQELTLKTIAITAPMTQQALNSVAGLQSFVQEELQFRQQLVIDWHILYGDGTDPKELDGFLTNTNAQTYLWSTGTANDTMADAVMRARLLIKPKGALVCTMNEADWLDILLAKATDEHYLMTAFGPMKITNEPNRRAIGDITVNIVDAMQQGDFLLANHARASKFVDQQRSSFATGYVNAQFIENEITARHEDTIGHAIRNFQSYVYGSWDSQP